jgi:hypothetical protein
MRELDGLWWLLLLLGPLLLLQRRLHLETQAVFLLLTRRGDLALVLYSMLFFPGVLLHEASHYLMARCWECARGVFPSCPGRYLGEGCSWASLKPPPRISSETR